MLTQEQIQYLDQFCEKKGVRYHDLRMEIVDHLATEMETMMENSTCIDFPALMDAVFVRFGKNGFHSIVEAKEASVQEEYDRCHRRYARSFFTPPKIVLTLLITICLILPFLWVSEKTLLQIARVYFLITGFVCVLSICGILLRPGKNCMPLLLLKGVKRKSLNRNIGLLILLFVNGLNILRKGPPLPHGIGSFIATFTVLTTMGHTSIFIARYQAVLKMYAKAKREYSLAFMKQTSRSCLQTNKYKYWINSARKRAYSTTTSGRNW